MIFHPLVWRGIPLRVIDGEPLGLIGWQGIVPAKAGVMAERMVDMVTTQLVDVEEVNFCFWKNGECGKIFLKICIRVCARDQSIGAQMRVSFMKCASLRTQPMSLSRRGASE